MKMRSNIFSKIRYHFLWGIISVATLPYTSSIPTTLSPIKTSVRDTIQSNFQLNNIANAGEKASNEILFGNQQNGASLLSDNSLMDEKRTLDSHKTLENKQNGETLLNNNGSNKDFTTSGLNNNNINSPEEQLTALSTDENNSLSINSLIRVNSGDGTSLPLLSSTESMRHFSNNNIDNKNVENGITQSTLLSIPQSVYNAEPQTQLSAPSHSKTGNEPNRYKRSHNRNSLHSNLDDLLNMKRQRRALRYKRNTNYEDFLASILAAEEAKYNGNYDSYPSLSTNEVNIAANPQVLNYLMSHLDRDDDEDNYVDLDKLSQYYYENVLPLIEVDKETDSGSSEDNFNQELPVIVHPYAQQVIPVLNYPLPNRYQRIRKSYYRRYQNPLSLYTGLKRKRSHNNYDNSQGEWGRIVGARDERSAYEDDAEEANKIYSLATLLATRKTPEEYSPRYKRSVKRQIMNIM